MAENKGFKGDEGGLDEEAEISSEKKQEDLVGKKSEKENPGLKDSDADFEDLEDDGGGGNAVGDGLERLWTGLGSLLSRHNRWKITFVFTVITVLALAGDDLLSFLVLTMELIGDVFL